MVGVLVLNDIIERLADYDAREAIVYVPADAGEIDGDTPVTLTYMGDEEDANVPGGPTPPGTTYFLEASMMTYVVEVFERELGVRLTTAQKVKAISYYAEHDGFMRPKSSVLAS
jgi:hypothetical protein